MLASVLCRSYLTLTGSDIGGKGLFVRAASEVALRSMAVTCFPISVVDIDRGKNLSIGSLLLSEFFVTTMSKAVAIIAVSHPPTSQWTWKKGKNWLEKAITIELINDETAQFSLHSHLKSFQTGCHYGFSFPFMSCSFATAILPPPI